ncbi:MAG: AAA family ATPase [Deltaproteobacteria bacterium]|nr:AAA family ATPase [Deltaproteobacteria bacterium]
MEFYDVLNQALILLEREKRVSYRALKRQFSIDDEYLEDLKAELIDAKKAAIDEDGKVLVWVERDEQKDATRTDSQEPRVQSPAAKPITYTPPHLVQRILAEQVALEGRGPEGERKSITVLFADIKGSMSLIEDLDPEDAQHIIDPALQLMMDAVHRYEGFVSQSTGDGIFAFFGAPIASEDHPQRALYAALQMQQESKRFAENLRREKGVNFQIRVGLNTGEVVLRSIRKDDLHADYVPVGHSTSLAARMQTLADPGSIVVSESTYKLAEGYFSFKSLGAMRIKGVSEPINVYEALGVGPLRTRLQLSVRRGLVRFVGRQGELSQMQRALGQTKEGHGQIVAMMGEPGVGKSRLCYEFKLLSQTGCLVLETFSVAHGKAYPYLPLIDLLKNYFQITPGDDERRRREKVMGRVLALDRNLEDILPSLFSLLGIDKPSAAPQEVDPQVKRQRIFDAVKRLLVRESLNQPLLLLFEDLQWVDAETQAFLLFLSESIASTRMLLLVNYRPEYQHSWGSRTYYTQLRLDPLKQEEAGIILAALLEETGGELCDSPLQPLKRLILEKTEGNPFFMEEIVRALFEQGVLARDPGGVFLTKAITDVHIPPTVQGVLTARIDRLGGEQKELLQSLAVIGKEFSFSLVTQVLTIPESRLRGLLSYLQAEEFIYEQPTFPEPSFSFKHALTQEVAYNSLLMERRRIIHERVARGIEAVLTDRLEDHYSELAHHYSHSGNTEKAIEYLQKAGQQAVQRSAYAEAIEQFSSALELLQTLPDTPKRVQQELTLQIALGMPLILTKGYGVPEVARVYTRARKLYEQIGGSPQLLPVLFSLWRFYFVRGAYQIAHELAEQFTPLVQGVQDPTLLLPAYLAPGMTFFRLGEFATAREHLERGVELYNLHKERFSRSDTLIYGPDPGVLFLSYTAWTVGHLGYLDQALQRSQEAVSLAHELAHPISEAFALQFAATVHRFRGESRAAQERAEAVLTVAQQQGFPFWMAGGTFVRGWALAEQGRGQEGMAQMRQGIEAWRTIGIQTFGQPFVMLAEVCGKTGEPEEGFRLLIESLTEVRQSGERWWEAELHRVKGELTLQSKISFRQVQDKSQRDQKKSESPSTQHATPHPQAEAEAEESFLKAIDIARRQQAKWPELRAALCLSRLWLQQRKREEARALLTEVYEWFTEGFDTADLQAAKELLNELN